VGSIIKRSNGYAIFIDKEQAHQLKEEAKIEEKVEVVQQEETKSKSSLF